MRLTLGILDAQTALFMLAIMESVYVMTGRTVWRDMTKFWGLLFGINFAMGVATGIVMEFQFGTNWGVLAEKMGSIQGPLLGYESFTAFMLEATFFGVMLLGRERVSPRFYFIAPWLAGGVMLILCVAMPGSRRQHSCPQSPVGAPLGFRVPVSGSGLI